MRNLLSPPAKGLQTFSEPFWASTRLKYINSNLKYAGAGLAALILSMFFLTSVAHAQFQLQRLYTAPNGEPLVCLLQGDDGNFYGTLINASAGYVFKMTPSGAVTTIAFL